MYSSSHTLSTSLSTNHIDIAIYLSLEGDGEIGVKAGLFWIMVREWDYGQVRRLFKTSQQEC